MCQIHSKTIKTKDFNYICNGLFLKFGVWYMHAYYIKSFKYMWNSFK